MTWRERILDTGEDRDAWLGSRSSIIGASDAAGYVKPESVDKYVLAKLRAAHSTFTGNRYTESGHFWEPYMLAWSMTPENKALIHSPGKSWAAATPDGIRELSDGSIRLAECKAKHGRVVTGPDPKEWRQMAWQLHAVPEASGVEFIWAEIISDSLREGSPQHIFVPRDHPKIIAARDLILPIAAQVHARLIIAQQAMEEFTP
ncbi:YqaJ viral recombinase family protein [Mycetocola spongiae]|uniref:YqaJ viral recombinase family protein n=1 Tax=Mycetocola spongiae TaxID=2859226 RepID=UPI001CF23160|nr:YqaJ viral recombinase family protein [Mycetocola spongiae]UCR89277.1 YqaJ viral recombinase family protein [Mycetocola spongiae]